MNLQQAQSVLNQAKLIETINFEELVTKVYPDRTDLENIELSQMSLPEFLYLSKRMFQQFISEFENRENTVVLPLLFNHPDTGTVQVDSQLQAFFTNVTADNINSAEPVLSWLIAYQIENGFYNKQIKKSSERSNNPDKLAEKLNLIQSSITNTQKQAETQIIELETAKKEIQNLIAQKREELTQITTNLTTANTQTNQINELLTKGTDQSSRLTTLLEQQEQNKVAADTKLLQLQELYSTTNDKLTENVKAVLNKMDEFKKQVETNQGHLEFIEGKREFFDERIKYLEDLIGREVGASLFETFKQRKNELESPVRFWRWAVPIMSIATVLWVFFLFRNQTQVTDINVWWQSFAINTLKTIPAIFLLYFSIGQYRKERNFQEEYAFKSAVALTIKAYSNQLEDAKNKDALIMEAVLNVYKTPIEDNRSEKIKSKNAMKTINTMVDTTSELVKKI